MAGSVFLGSVYATAELRTEGVESGAKKMKGQLNDLEGTTEKSSKSIIGMLSGIGSGFVDMVQSAAAPSAAFAATGLLVGKSMIGTAATLETARQGFVTLLGSAEKADAALAQIKKDASTTPFTLTGLIQSNQLLTQVTKDAPKSEALLLNVGKALAAAGKGQPELDRIIANLQQIGNTSKITEMDVRQFGNSGINILELLADYYGVTKDEAGEMVKDSENAFADLEGAFAKAGGAGGKFARAYIDQAGTMNQLTSNFTDALDIAGAQIITESGAFGALKGALGGVIDLITNNTGNIVNAIKTIGENKIVFYAIAGAITGALVPALITAALFFAPLIPFIAVGAALGAGIWALVSAFGGLNGVASVFSGIMMTLSPFLKFVSDLFSSLASAFTLYIVPAFQDFATSVMPSLQAGLLELHPALAQLTVAFGELWTALKPLLPVIAAILGAVISLGLAILNGLITALSMMLPWVITVFTGIVQFITGVLQLIYGILTLNADLMSKAWEKMNEGFKNVIFGAFTAILAAIVGFVTGFINYFKHLYDVLIGHSIVPDLVMGMIQVFGELPGAIGAIFVDLWNAIVGEVSTWPGKLFDWGKNIIESFANGIRSAIGAVGSAISDALGAARKFIEGHSPPVAGPWKNIDIWGYNVGSSWVQGVQTAMSGLSLDGSVKANLSSVGSAPTPINQTIAPSVNVYMGVYAGTEIEKRNIAVELQKSLAQYQKGIGVI